MLVITQEINCSRLSLTLIQEFFKLQKHIKKNDNLSLL